MLEGKGWKEGADFSILQVDPSLWARFCQCHLDKKVAVVLGVGTPARSGFQKDDKLTSVKAPSSKL